MRATALGWVIVLCACVMARAEDAQKPRELSGAVLLKGPPSAAAFPLARVPAAVDLCILENLPGTDPKTLWSVWGDGCLASNGRFYFSIGNHLEMTGKSTRLPGESRIYEYDPAARILKIALNVRDIIPSETVAGGKVHSRLQEGRDGWLYFTTYWGKIPTDDDWKTFKGSNLLRFDPRTGKAEDLGVPVPGQGLPTSILDPQRMLVYYTAVYSEDLVLYDLAQKRVLFRGGGDVQEGSRNLMLDGEGNAYFSTKDGKLGRFDLASKSIRATKAILPDDSADAKKKAAVLRASTRQSSKGIIYGMTGVGRLFAFNPKSETIEDLGPNVGNQYTAVMVLSPDERFIYYAPGAHGSGSAIGSPVVQYDIAAKKHKVLAYLNPIANEQFTYTVGGTYGMAISPDGSTLFIAFNGAAIKPGAKKVETFGKPCLVAVHVPKEERS